MIYLYQGFHRKNPLFTVWLCTGVMMQLAAAWGLAAGWPKWMNELRLAFDVLLYLNTLAVLVLAAMRRGCPVNRNLLWGLGAMLALNLFARFLGNRVEQPVQIWLRNIGFFGPALFLLIALSGVRLDQIPLWITSPLGLALGSGQQTAMASAAVSDLNYKGSPEPTNIS